MCNTVNKWGQQLLVKCNYSTLLNMVKTVCLIFSGKKTTSSTSSSFPSVWVYSPVPSPLLFSSVSLRPYMLCWHADRLIFKTRVFKTGHAGQSSKPRQSVFLLSMGGLRLPELDLRKLCIWEILSQFLCSNCSQVNIECILLARTDKISFILKNQYSWKKNSEFCILNS